MQRSVSCLQCCPVVTGDWRGAACAAADGGTGGKSGSESPPRPFLVDLRLGFRARICVELSVWVVQLPNERGCRNPELCAHLGEHRELTVWCQLCSVPSSWTDNGLFIFCTCCPASPLLTKGEELEIPASLSSHCSTISAALDARGFVRRNSPQRPGWRSSLLT